MGRGFASACRQFYLTSHPPHEHASGGGQGGRSHAEVHTPPCSQRLCWGQGADTLESGGQGGQTLQVLPDKDDRRARLLAVAEILGKLDRDLEKAGPLWLTVACSSLGSSWTRKTEVNSSLKENNAALPSSWESGSGSCVTVGDTFGCRELVGLLEDIPSVLLTSLSADLEMGS